MKAISCKVVGIQPIKDSEYKRIFLTSALNGGGIGTATYAVKSRGQYSLGQEVRIVYSTKRTSSGEVFQCWEIVDF